MFQKFYSVMIAKDRWFLILRGLGNTLLISLCALAIGTILGCIFALCRISKSKTLNIIANIYTTIIRGIPMATATVISFFIFISP